MNKISFVILALLALTSCTTGTRDIEIQHWAYVHQVIDQYNQTNLKDYLLTHQYHIHLHHIYNEQLCN